MNDVRFFDPKPEQYPFTVEFLSVQTDEVVHSIHVDGPGAMEIPSLIREHGRTWVRIKWGDGEVTESK